MEDDRKRDELIVRGILTEQVVTHSKTRDGYNHDIEGDNTLGSVDFVAKGRLRY